MRTACDRVVPAMSTTHLLMIFLGLLGTLPTFGCLLRVSSPLPLRPLCLLSVFEIHRKWVWVLLKLDKRHWQNTGRECCWQVESTVSLCKDESVINLSYSFIIHYTPHCIRQGTQWTQNILLIVTNETTHLMTRHARGYCCCWWCSHCVCVLGGNCNLGPRNFGFDYCKYSEGTTFWRCSLRAEVNITWAQTFEID